MSTVKRFLEQRIDTACPRSPPCTPEQISGLCAFCNYRNDKEAEEQQIVREALASAYADQIADAEFDSTKQELRLRSRATDAEGVAAMNSPISKTVASQSFPVHLYLRIS